MNVKKLFTDDRAVSPVVGVALLIAITVILAAVIGGVVLGLGSTSADAPQAQLQFDMTNDNIDHEGGDPLPADEVKIQYDNSSDGTINNTKTLSEDLQAGGSIGVGATVYEGDTVTVVWDDPNSDSSTVIAKFEE